MNHTLLTCCYTLADVNVVSPLLAYFTEQGYRSFYRRYYPRLVVADTTSHDAIVLINATHWQPARYTVTEPEIECLAQFVQRGGLLILASSTASDLYPDHANVEAFNRLLTTLEIPIVIHENQIDDAINTYAGTIRQMPYQQSVSHAFLEKHKKLTLDPTNTLTVGRGADVLLSTYPTAECGTASTAAVGKAGEGYVLVINGEAYLSMGFGVISTPILETERLVQARTCMEQITAYVHRLRISEIPWQPNGDSFLKTLAGNAPTTGATETHQDTSDRVLAEKEASSDVHHQSTLHQHLPASTQVIENRDMPIDIFGHITQSGLPSFVLYRPPWRDTVDSEIYGWIHQEKIRAGWCYISTGDRSYRKRLTQMAKDAKLNLLWGAANSHLEFSDSPHAQDALTQYALDITEELDPLWDESHSHSLRVGWFMGFQFPNMQVERATHSDTIQVDGVVRDNPSPVDLSYWERHIFPRARELATFSKAHLCVRGVMLDLEMYGFPLWFHPDTCDFGDTAFSCFLSHEQAWLTASQREHTKALPPRERFVWLMEQGVLERYVEILSERAFAIGRGLKEAIHEIHPNLI